MNIFFQNYYDTRIDMAYRKNHKTFSESRKKKKRTKRSRQVFRQKLFLCTVMMGSVVFLSAAAFQKISDGQANKAENISKEGAEAKTASVYSYDFK